MPSHTEFKYLMLCQSWVFFIYLISLSWGMGCGILIYMHLHISSSSLFCLVCCLRRCGNMNGDVLGIGVILVWGNMPLALFLRLCCRLDPTAICFVQRHGFANFFRRAAGLHFHSKDDWNGGVAHQQQHYENEGQVLNNICYKSEGTNKG